jgi:hypothetical protein
MFCSLYGRSRVEHVQEPLARGVSQYVQAGRDLSIVIVHFAEKPSFTGESATNHCAIVKERST